VVDEEGMRPGHWLASVHLSFLQCFETDWLDNRKGIRQRKKSVLLISKGSVPGTNGTRISSGNPSSPTKRLLKWRLLGII